MYRRLTSCLFTRFPYRLLHTIPEPPHDLVSMKPPKNTHVHFYLTNGGSARLLDYLKALYKIDNVVFVRLPSFESFFIFDPEEMMKVHHSASPTPIGLSAAIFPFTEFYSKYQNKYNATPISYNINPQSWLPQRHAIQKGIFDREEAFYYLPVVSKVTKDATNLLPKYWNDIDKYLTRVAFELVYAILFGNRVNVLDLEHADAEDLRYLQTSSNATSLAGKLYLNPYGHMIPKYEFLSDEQKEFIRMEDLEDWNSFIENNHAVLDISKTRIGEILEGGDEKPQPLVARYRKDKILSLDELIVNVAGLIL